MKFIDSVICSAIICYASCTFHIQNSDHFPVGVEDVGIRFYLTVLNVMNKDITVVKAHDPECCWQVEPGDIDCESMELFGGFPTNIAPGGRKNISYVFSNLYPLDRAGSCKFFLKEKGDKAVQHTVYFNTTEMESEDGRSVFRELLGSGVYIYRRCDGVDENMRNYCRPFDCSKKYNGFRNFYRREKGKCEPVARCKTKLGKDNLPTSAFDFENNRCKSLVPKVSKQEEKVADNMMDQSSLANEFKKYDDADPLELKINCNHGKQVGRHCRCDEGWRTVSVSTDNGGIMMDWCSKRAKKVTLKADSPNMIMKYALLIILIGVSSCLISFMVVLWWKLLFNTLVPKLMKRYRRATLSSFPCSYNPLWKIGKETYDSNKTENLFNDHRISDSSDDLSDQELNVTSDRIIGVVDTTRKYSRSDDNSELKVKAAEERIIGVVNTNRLFEETKKEYPSTDEEDTSGGPIDLKDSASFVLSPNFYPSVMLASLDQSVHSSMPSMKVTDDLPSENLRQSVSERGAMIELIRKIRLNSNEYLGTLPSDDEYEDV